MQKNLIVADVLEEIKAAESEMNEVIPLPPQAVTPV